MIEILYQDADIVVCVKPIGAESEDSGAKGMPALLRRTLAQGSDVDETAPIFTVHRLDKQVSGVMVYAKTKHASAQLSAQMQAHRFTKEYRAVVEGVLPENPPNTEEIVPRETICKNQISTKQTEKTAPLAQGRWEDLLYHDKRKNKVFVVKKERKGVKHAALRYAVLGIVAAANELPSIAENSENNINSFSISNKTELNQSAQTATLTNKQLLKPENKSLQTPAFSLLRIHLETGRTHQIRVQCASRKLPLVGDNRYGSVTKGCDIALFSHSISFAHPRTGEAITFTKDTPDTYPWNLF